MVEASDVLTDERWPDLGALLADNGVRSILGAPIRLGGTSIGSLNVYKSVAHAWDDSDRRALASLERIVGNLLWTAVAADRNEAVTRQLTEALQSRVAIERAVGIVMAVEGVDATAAFERIRRSARSGRRSIRDVAAEVTRSRKVP
jgi:GAF domain-containing protein